MAKPTRARTMEQRLRLFDRHVTEVLGESGGKVGWSLRFDLVAETIETTEPPREALRSYLMSIRLLDSPGERDLYLPNLFDDVASFDITPESRAILEVLRNRYELAQRSNGLELADEQGRISPRDAFELLAYSDHLHRDADKEARLEEMGEPFRAMILQQGHLYANAVSNTAMLLRSVARADPATGYLFAVAPPGTPTSAELLEASQGGGRCG